MTPERMRVKLAEWAGWKRCVCGDSHCGAWFPPGSDDPALETPDYTTELNAVRELEMKLTEDQCRSYQSHLIDCIRPRFGWSLWELVRASAIHRCEALCRTLNLWEGE